MLALSGSFTVAARAGSELREYRLGKPDQALYIPAGVWHQLKNFSSGAICLVVTSEPYDPADYFDDIGTGGG